ncbi:hypothetical protein DFH27DRAFT_529300 [Peziza echinospora]|nr:hypothetical protein DFH27DRAFT_529300 [Peziza echinospora]
MNDGTTRHRGRRGMIVRMLSHCVLVATISNAPSKKPMFYAPSPRPQSRHYDGMGGSAKSIADNEETQQQTKQGAQRDRQSKVSTIASNGIRATGNRRRTRNTNCPELTEGTTASCRNPHGCHRQRPRATESSFTFMPKIRRKQARRPPSVPPRGDISTNHCLSLPPNKGYTSRNDPRMSSVANGDDSNSGHSNGDGWDSVFAKDGFTIRM